MSGFGTVTQLPVKAALYLRVSTHYQVDKDSLKVQRRDLEAYCRLMLRTENFVVFEDPGFSAKNTDRPEYQKMMRRIRSGEFSHLLVWKLDRISRNLLDFSGMYKELQDLGVTFISLNEQFDTSSAMGEAMLKIILVFAELERKMTSERVSAVMISRAKEGKWNGGKVPYGYFYDKETQEFSVNREEKAIFDRAWDLYEDRQSITSVVHWLNEKGFKTRNGNAWSAPAVHNLLSNEWYIGNYIYSKNRGSKKNSKPEDLVVKKGHHPALVSEVRFERVHIMLMRNGRGVQQRTYERKHVHIFAGVLCCGICGNGMNASLDRRLVSGWQPSIYGCARRRKDSVCSNKFVSDKTVGPFVFNIIGNILKFRDAVSEKTTVEELQQTLLSGKAFDNVASIDPDGLSQLLELMKAGYSGIEYTPAASNMPSEELNQLDSLRERKRKLEIAEKRLSSIYLYSDTSMPEDEYIDQKRRISEELARIEEQMSDLGEADDGFSKSDYKFLEQASYFVMIQQLINAPYIDYEKYIRNIDPVIAKTFIRTVFSNIEVVNGQITKMVFTNGITLHYNYK